MSRSKDEEKKEREKTEKTLLDYMIEALKPCMAQAINEILDDILAPLK